LYTLGWDARWDELVERKRLRWSVDHDKISPISVNDRVELWCCGQSVPGAWLDTVVKKIKRNLYGVLKSHSSSVIWVPRDRIRPLKLTKDQLALYNSHGDGEYEYREEGTTACLPICHNESRCSIM
jgi:hypothetical protein